MDDLELDMDPGSDFEDEDTQEYLISPAPTDGEYDVETTWHWDGVRWHLVH
jgi:hypothetical protein